MKTFQSQPKSTHKSFPVYHRKLDNFHSENLQKTLRKCYQQMRKKKKWKDQTFLDKDNQDQFIKEMYLHQIQTRIKEDHHQEDLVLLLKSEGLARIQELLDLKRFSQLFKKDFINTVKIKW